MNAMSRRRRRGSPVGWLVLGVGLLAVLGLVLNGFLASYLWPLLVILPGLGLFSAVKQGGRSWAWLTVPATFVTSTGLVLLFTALTGWWASLAYLSALIVPGSIGLGLAVYGDLARKDGVARFGELLGKVGLGLTILGALFFEMLLNLNGIASGLGGIAIAAALVLAGLFLLVRPNRKKSKAYQGTSLPKSRLPHPDESLFDDDPLFREEPVKSRTARK